MDNNQIKKIRESIDRMMPEQTENVIKSIGKKQKQTRGKIVASVIRLFVELTILIGLAVLFFSSCSTTKYVPQPYPVPEIHEVVSTDTIFKSDSVYVKDSVATEVKNDTIHYHHYHTKYQTKWNGKTYIKRVCDSIPYPVPYEIVKTVPTPIYDEDMMPWYKRMVLHIGYGFSIALVVLLFILIRKKACRR